MEFPTALGLGIVITLVVVMALWFFSSSTRANEARREELKTKHISHQPWDSADGRANR
jgi:hypothetical protein